jgi:hypothetical protein
MGPPLNLGRTRGCAPIVSHISIATRYRVGRKGEKGRRGKGKKSELSWVPGFTGEAQGNNRAEDFG